MESKHFDQIAKCLAHPASRRVVARTAVMGALGVALSRMTTPGAAAQTCRRRGRPCEFDAECCSGECRHDVCRRHRERD